MLDFDQATLRERLAKLRPLQRVRFAHNCAERLLVKGAGPEYAGALKKLRQALDQVKSALDGTSVDIELYKRLLAECEDVHPVVDETNDLEEHVATTMYTLRCLIDDGDVQEAVWAAVAAYDEADHIAQSQLDIDLNLPDAEARLLALPVIQNELAAQEHDLAALEEE